MKKLLIYLPVLLICLSCGISDSEIDGLVDKYKDPENTKISEVIETISNSSIIMPSEGTYGEGSNLIFQLVFEEDMIVQGDPKLELNIGVSKRYVDYVSGSDSSVLEFHYTVDYLDHDLDGIYISNVVVDNGANVETKEGIKWNNNLVIENNYLTNVLIDTSIRVSDKITNIVTAPSVISGSLNLSWNVPESYDYGMIEYSVLYRKKGDSLWEEVLPRPTLNNLTISNLEYNVDYEIKIAGNNGVLSTYSDIKEISIFDIMSLNPIAWLDATDPNGDGSLPNDGSLISTWVDKTGLAENATESDINKIPYIEHNVFNGLPSIRFENLDRGLEGSFDRTEGTNLTIFIVGQYDEGYSDKCMFEFNGGGRARAFFIDRRYAGNNFYTPYKGSLNLWTINNQGSYASVFRNSLEELYSGSLTFNTDFVGTGNYVLGDDITGGNRMTGYISELLIFDNNLLEEEIQIIENYLINKWGL